VIRRAPTTRHSNGVRNSSRATRFARPWEAKVCALGHGDGPHRPAHSTPPRSRCEPTPRRRLNLSSGLGVVHSRRCAWISRVVNPRAYRAMIPSLNPSGRVWPFRTIFGSKLPGQVSWSLRIDRADADRRRLRGRPVATVPRATTGRVVLLLSQVCGQFLARRSFEDRLGDLALQPAQREQAHALRFRLGQQLVGHRRVHLRFAVRSLRSSRRYLNVTHSMVPSDRSVGSESGDVTYTDGLTPSPWRLLQRGMAQWGRDSTPSARMQMLIRAMTTR
jgi:hypothetical protein